MRSLTLWLAVAALVTGCAGALEGKRIEYKSAGKLPPLEVPPDLATPAGGGRYTVPSAQGERTTYSEYEKSRPAGTGVPAQAGVLPVTDKVSIERGGIQRWLVVKAPPEQVWLMVKDFWQENGFLLAEEDAEAGFMETDWAENRARIQVGGITGLINRALEQAVSLPERDRFRTRLERGPDNSTEVYVSHRGMAEVYIRERINNTRWQVRPSDPELEAAMLTRLAQRLGTPEQQVKALVKAADAAQPRASLVAGDGGRAVSMPEGFDRAWRRVGLALDRVGFMVEDRNRAEGVYFVRYQDPEAEAPRRSGASRLAFWRKDERKPAEQYRIQVAGSGDSSTVRVLDQSGKPDDSETGQRILGLLVEQLK